MLYLITGANGAGKTLNTLKWVRQRQLEENRPVCHNGRFEPVEDGELSNWKTIDIKNWQEEPDGTIFLVDECHNDFPLRPPSGIPPEYIRMLAEHRRRGFDFYLVTQHPQNIDAFVRRLIGPPGWHRHLKRSFGVDMVSVLEWSAVNPTCEKEGSGKNAIVTMQAFPKEVYGWYKSASLHTGKKRIPFKVWLFFACLIAIPFVIWLAFSMLPGNGDKKMEDDLLQKKSESPSIKREEPSNLRHLTTAQWLELRTPRVPDFPHTAPAYDKVTEPTLAPYPAACIEMRGNCKCYSQQATQLRVDINVCRYIVKFGYFIDWQQEKPEKITGRDGAFSSSRSRQMQEP